MPVKKIVVCAALFVLLVLAGGVLNNRLSAKQSAARNQSHDAPSVTIYSSFPSTGPVDRQSPFAPREYIRIIRRNTAE
ncbi:hypothetical protein [Paenibacillus arenilitoris]|uniref:Uncharacterized protein n=1 Tax=Paenibacillus arenilitoris TaxID=2772299 RepID=A0A927CQN0_9BACL|nr:hypothetical protein [Paenibacillus arenilitoris]MBD2871782.1 hypothetical protein [Paenibacillus arenilitoris]